MVCSKCPQETEMTANLRLSSQSPFENLGSFTRSGVRLESRRHRQTYPGHGSQTLPRVIPEPDTMPEVCYPGQGE